MSTFPFLASERFSTSSTAAVGNITFYDANANLIIGNSVSNVGNLIIYGNQDANSAYTGSLQVRGGMYIRGNLYCSGNIGGYTVVSAGYDTPANIRPGDIFFATGTSTSVSGVIGTIFNIQSTGRLSVANNGAAVSVPFGNYKGLGAVAAAQNRGIYIRIN